MCQTTGPKFFLPPNQLGSTGNAAAPVNYASNPQTTFDASNPANLPKPAPPPAPPAPSVNGGMFGRMFGGGGDLFGGGGMRRAMFS